MPIALDFAAPIRLSFLRLAAVGLVHAGLLALLLNTAAVATVATAPRALTVSLIEPEIEAAPLPEPEPRPAVAPARVTPTPLPAAKNRPAPAVPPRIEASPLKVSPAPQQATAAETSPPLPAPAAEITAPANPTAPIAPVAAAAMPEPPRPADYLANPAPPYPPLSRRLHEQGTVRLNVLVNPDGSVARLEVAQSSGHARLDRSAMETVQSRWKFEPARQDGRPLAAWVIVPIQFILRS